MVNPALAQQFIKPISSLSVLGHLIFSELFLPLLYLKTLLDFYLMLLYILIHFDILPLPLRVLILHFANIMYLIEIGF